MKLRALLLSLVFASAAIVPAFAAAAEAKIGNIILTAPAGWKVDTDPDARADRPTLRFQPPTGKDFYVAVTPFPVDKSSSIDVDGVHNLVASVAKTTGPRSVEKQLTVHELKSDGVQGYYFSATDPAPADGEWKYMTQGIVLVGKDAVGFTILTFDQGSPVPAQALAMLRGARAQ